MATTTPQAAAPNQTSTLRAILVILGVVAVVAAIAFAARPTDPDVTTPATPAVVQAAGAAEVTGSSVTPEQEQVTPGVTAAVGIAAAPR